MSNRYDRTLTGQLGQRRIREADVRFVSYVRSLGHGQHLVRNMFAEKDECGDFVVGSLRGDITWKPGTTVPLASNTGYPQRGQMIMGNPPPGQRGASTVLTSRPIARVSGPQVEHRYLAISHPTDSTWKAYLYVNGRYESTIDEQSFSGGDIATAHWAEGGAPGIYGNYEQDVHHLIVGSATSQMQWHWHLKEALTIFDPIEVLPPEEQPPGWLEEYPPSTLFLANHAAEDWDYTDDERYVSMYPLPPFNYGGGAAVPPCGGVLIGGANWPSIVSRPDPHMIQYLSLDYVPFDPEYPDRTHVVVYSIGTVSDAGFTWPGDGYGSNMIPAGNLAWVTGIGLDDEPGLTFVRYSNYDDGGGSRTYPWGNWASIGPDAWDRVCPDPVLLSAFETPEELLAGRRRGVAVSHLLPDQDDNPYSEEWEDLGAALVKTPSGAWVIGLWPDVLISGAGHDRPSGITEVRHTPESWSPASDDLVTHQGLQASPTGDLVWFIPDPAGRYMYRTSLSTRTISESAQPQPIAVQPAPGGHEIDLMIPLD